MASVELASVTTGLLLVLPLALAACEEPAEDASARRQWVEEATAMEPLPGAEAARPPAASPTPAPAPTPEPSEPEPPPPLDVLVDLMVEVSTQSWTFADFVDEVRDPAGGCGGRIARVRAHLERANARTVRTTDRFIELLPRYSQAEQQEASRKATIVFGQELERGQAHVLALARVMDGFRGDCPRQIGVMAGLRQHRQRVIGNSILRVDATGLLLRPGG